MKIKLFFIALNGGGNMGKAAVCNDSLIAVDRSIPQTDAPLSAALTELFSIHDRFYGQSGLYNALSGSRLKLESSTITKGKAKVTISGTIGIGGLGDDPRVYRQIRAVVMQFPSVKEASIFFNGVPLEKELTLIPEDLKCESSKGLK